MRGLDWPDAVGLCRGRLKGFQTASVCNAYGGLFWY